MVPAYLVVSILGIAVLAPWLGREIFPLMDAGQFRMRLRAPDGTHINRTEEIAKQALQLVADEVGPENVERTLGYVGAIPSSYPINAVFQWSRGPEEAILLVATNDAAGIGLAEGQGCRCEGARGPP